MDLYTIVDQLIREGAVEAVANNPLAQFGPPQQPLMGATLLPEREAEANIFRESNIRYQTIIANAGTRYGPVQIKDGSVLAGDFLVELGDADIGAEFKAREYEALMRLLNQRNTQEAMARVIDWADTALNLALIHLEEIQRWQAIVDAVIIRLGDNGYREPVPISNPAGHRFTVVDAWTDPTIDPMAAINQGAKILRDLGYANVNRMISSTRVQDILVNNPKMIQRTAAVTIMNGNLAPVQPVQSLAALDSVFRAHRLPGLETFDARYNTQQAKGLRFLPDDVLVMCATTGQSEEIRYNQTSMYIPETLGYTAVGFAAGQPTQGRVIRLYPHDDKPPRIEGQAWETFLPVITDPQAIVVLRGIH